MLHSPSATWLRKQRQLATERRRKCVQQIEANSVNNKFQLTDSSANAVNGNSVEQKIVDF